MPKIVFVAAHDSQFKWAVSAAVGFLRTGWTVTYFCPEEHSDISEQQILEAGADPRTIQFGNGEESIDYWRQHDVVVFPTPGDITEPYLLALHEVAESEPHSPRPLTVCGYVGLVISNHEQGFAARCAADLICVNSKMDLEVLSKTAKELGVSTNCLALIGLPILPESLSTQKQGPIDTVVFADQMAIPRLKSQRRYLYSRLINYALSHPERRVIVKPRHRPSEGSYKKGLLSPESFFENADLPKNLVIEYTPIAKLLEHADLMLTISSTAAVEAIAAGSRTALIADFGFDSGLGNRVFIGSELLRTFDQIDNDELSFPNQQWLHDFLHLGNSADCLLNEIQLRLDLLKQNDLPLPSLPYLQARKKAVQQQKSAVEKPMKSGLLSQLFKKAKRIVRLAG